MSLAGLLLVADGSPGERARLAEVQGEMLDVLFGSIDVAEPVISPTLRLAAVRSAMTALYIWCPLLREAEKVAAENALCLAVASLDLSNVFGEGGPDLACSHSRSWSAFCSAAKADPENEARLERALAIKRQLLKLTAALERLSAEGDLPAVDRDAERQARTAALHRAVSTALRDSVHSGK